MTRDLTAETFKAEILDVGADAVVDFFADWCAPCRAQAPILDRLAATAGAAVVAKVDVEANPELAELFQVRALPTLIVFRNGRIARRFTGLTDGATLAAALAA